MKKVLNRVDMFLIFTKQVILETNHVVLMEISGGFPRQCCDVPDVAKTPSLLHKKKNSVVQNKLDI